MTPETKAKLRAAATGRVQTEHTREILREKALASPHRRLKKRMIEYRGERLDSTWELALAKRLDALGVEWSRPAPIVWVDEHSRIHHYFPDFFLPKYRLYLDPKNPAALRSQAAKLQQLLQQYSNIVILTTLEACERYTPIGAADSAPNS